MVNGSVLIIEDDRFVASELQGRLGSLGYKVQIVAKSESEAVHRIKETRPDIVLLDVHLGKFGHGLQTAEKIRTQFDIPVIYIASEMGDDTLERLKISEPYGFLIRPFSDTVIHTTLEMGLYRHRIQKTIRENQQQTSAILKSIEEGVIAVDDQATILFMNPVAVLLSGWQEKDAVGQKIDSVLKFSDHTTNKVIEISALVKSLQRTSPLTGHSVLLTARDGRETPVEVTLAPMRDQRMETRGVVLGIRDVSELHSSIQQMRIHINRSETLMDIIAQVNSHLDLDQLMPSLLQGTSQMLQADASLAFLIDENSEVYRIVSTYSPHKKLHENLYDYDDAEFDLQQDIFAVLAPESQSIYVVPAVQDLRETPLKDFFLRQGITSVVIARFHRDNQVFGALAIGNTGQPRKFSRDDLLFIKGLADQASIAITNARLFEHVRASRGRLQMLSKRLVDVQEAERRSLARELHDQVGQMLTGLQFTLELGKRKADDDLKNLLGESQEMVSSLMSQIRNLSMRLLPAMLDDMGLLPTLHWMFDNYTRQTNVQIHFTHAGMDRRFSPDLETTVYRIIQESLTNIARYAKTDEAFVDLNVNEGILRIQVQDHGAGFDTEKTLVGKPTFGVAGMRERTYLAGGQFTIQSSPGKGTQLTAALPIEQQIERRRHDR